jgi:sec-independent protein translocase protein TatA
MFNLPPTTTPVLALFGSIGTPEALVILVIGLLLFGRRLPDVGRSLGRGIVEFRRGLSGIENEISEASARPAPTSLPRESATRPPLTEGGQDVRVSRSPEQVPATPDTAAGQA